LARFSERFAPIGFRASSFLASYGMAELSLGLTFAETGGGCRSRRLGLDQLDMGEGVETDLGRGRTFAICGSPLPNHEIELRSESGEPVPEGRVGTIFARGPSVMQGYFNDPVATAEALHADGWLNTGDLGVIIDGELIVTGRAKDLIIINGRNIWPQDIEWTIENHISAARESGVVAFGQDAGEDDEEEIAVVIECRLPEEARPELISDTDALVRRTHGIAPRVILSKPGLLPRTTSGKLSRAKARAMYLSGSFAV
ncbi:MAG: AMP-binding protein, partial [Pseudomonadota bacterium]